MPFAEVKVLGGVFTHTQKQELVKKITDVLVSYLGENLRSNTMVVVQEIKLGEWGIGGQPITADQVLSMAKGIPVPIQNSSILL